MALSDNSLGRSLSDVFAKTVRREQPKGYLEIDIDRVPQSLFQWSRRSSDARTATDNCVSRWMTEARYLSVVWSAGQLKMPHADLWIERLYEWIGDRNIHSRCVG